MNLVDKVRLYVSKKVKCPQDFAREMWFSTFQKPKSIPSLEGKRFEFLKKDYEFQNPGHQVLKATLITVAADVMGLATAFPQAWDSNGTSYNVLVWALDPAGELVISLCANKVSLETDEQVIERMVYDRVEMLSRKKGVK